MILSKFKKRGLVLVGVLFVGLSLASASALAEKITLFSNATVYKAMGGEEGLVSEFEKKTGIEVEVVTAEDPHPKAIAEYLAGGGAYDVVTLLYYKIGAAGAENFLEPLDKYIGGAGENYKFDEILGARDVRSPPPDGPLRGIPFRIGTAMMYYRKDLFEQYGVKVPESWYEYLLAAEKLTLDLDGDGKTDITGCAPRLFGDKQVTETYVRWLFGHGGNIFSADLSRSTLQSEPALNTMRDLTTVIREGWTPPDFLNFGRDKQIRAMQVGNGAAMCISYSPYWGPMTDPATTEIPGKLGWALVPSSPGVERGRTLSVFWMLSMDKNSRNKEASWKLIQWLTNPENQLTMALKYGNGPVQASVYRSPAYLEKYALAKDWLESLAVSKSFPAIKDWPKIEDTIGEFVQSAAMGDLSPYQAVQAMHARVSELLGK